MAAHSDCAALSFERSVLVQIRFVGFYFVDAIEHSLFDHLGNIHQAARAVLSNMLFDKQAQLLVFLVTQPEIDIVLEFCLAKGKAL